MNSIKNLVRRLLGKKSKSLSARNAYNLIASSYDQKPNQIIPKLDQFLVEELLKEDPGDIANSFDYGAGTGRNIPLLSSLSSDSVYAYDISIEMLNILKAKFPQTILVSAKNRFDLSIATNSIDLILCNLCIGYVKDIESLFAEWDRVLSKQGMIILTDIHVDLLANGNRNFDINGSTIYIDHFLHEEKTFHALFSKFNWEISQFQEMKVDENVKSIFEQKLDSYSALEGKKMLFGYKLKKN